MIHLENLKTAAGPGGEICEVSERKGALQPHQVLVCRETRTRDGMRDGL